MRAMILTEYGDPNVLQLTELPIPEVGPRDVLVDVKATSVNPVDTKIRQGGQRGAIRYKLPWVLGLDVSGVVSAVGQEVTRFQVGDAVYGSPTHRRHGCAAEHVVIDEHELAHKPKNLTHQEAASLPLVAQTAMDCLLPHLEGKPGQRVLVQAGAGGVGSVAIQIAKIYDAYVATTCSPRNAEFVRDLGADEVIDYRERDVFAEDAQWDVVLEAIGPDERNRALQVVPKGGAVASITGGLPDNTKKYGPNLGVVVTGLSMGAFCVRGWLSGKKARNVVRRSSSSSLEQLTTWVEAGQVRPCVHQVFDLEDLADAHAALERGGGRGKIVVEVAAVP